MDGCKVIVHDCIYDEYDQECEVQVTKKTFPHPLDKRKTIECVTKIALVNEEYLFEYNPRGQCLNGDFLVFAKPIPSKRYK